MQYVNTTSRKVYSRSAGMMRPGDVSSGRGRDSRRLEEVLESIISECRNGIGVRLNQKEADLLNRLMELDEMGSRFNPSSIPEEIRKDPDGAKSALEASRKAQQAEMDAIGEKNAKSIRREAEINGETMTRKPVGPATMEGEKVEPYMLKTGFEKIMEENAKIAAGKTPSNKDAGEILDPIGAHAKATDKGDSHQETPDPSETRSIGKDPVAVKQASGLPDDGTRTADTEVPEAVAPDRSNKMDEQAADIANKLSTFGPAEGTSSKKTRGRGRKTK